MSSEIDDDYDNVIVSKMRRILNKKGDFISSCQKNELLAESRELSHILLGRHSIEIDEVSEMTEFETNKRPLVGQYPLEAMDTNRPPNQKQEYQELPQQLPVSQSPVTLHTHPMETPDVEELLIKLRTKMQPSKELSRKPDESSLECHELRTMVKEELPQKAYEPSLVCREHQTKAKEKLSQIPEEPSSMCHELRTMVKEELPQKTDEPSLVGRELRIKMKEELPQTPEEPSLMCQELCTMVKELPRKPEETSFECHELHTKVKEELSHTKEPSLMCHQLRTMMKELPRKTDDPSLVCREILTQSRELSLNSPCSRDISKKGKREAADTEASGDFDNIENGAPQEQDELAFGCTDSDSGRPELISNFYRRDKLEWPEEEREPNNNNNMVTDGEPTVIRRETCFTSRRKRYLAYDAQQPMAIQSIPYFARLWNKPSIDAEHSGHDPPGAQDSTPDTLRQVKVVDGQTGKICVLFCPDDEFMDGDKYLGDKGKRPLTSRQVVKKHFSSDLDDSSDSETKLQEHEIEQIMGYGDSNNNELLPAIYFDDKFFRSRN